MQLRKNINKNFLKEQSFPTYDIEKKMNCIIFNPGECAGIMKGKNQIGIVDLNNLRPKIINF